MALIPPDHLSSISPSDLGRAVEETLNVTGTLIEPELLEVLLHNHDHYRKIVGYSFKASMRPALDASCIRNKEKRHVYAGAIARYYQPRAQAARRRKYKKVPSKAKTLIVAEDEKGQKRLF